jgi:hypothetical protein
MILLTHKIIIIILLNIYLIVSLKTIKIQIFKNLNLSLKLRSFFLTFISFLCCFMLFYDVISQYNAIYIFCIYSSIDFLSLIIRYGIIQIYYKSYFVIDHTQFDYYVYYYIFSSVQKKIIKLILLILYIFFYKYIFINFVILLYFSLYEILYKFDHSFDDAFFGSYNGFNIKLSSSGILKIKKYQRDLLGFNQRTEDDYHLVFGKDFKFKKPKNNNLYKKGFI